MSIKIQAWIVAAIAFVGCTARSGVFEGDVTLSDGRVLSKATTTLFADNGERTVVFEYETALDLVSCEAMRREVRQVWSEYLQAEADRRGATEAQVAPIGRSSGVSYGFLLSRQSDGAWHEVNFGICR